jgi:flagellar motor switch protein FliM
MQPVLTQEELEAIYAAMKGDDLPSASIDDISLSTGQEYIRRAETKWNEALKAMMPGLEGILTGAMGRRINAHTTLSEVWPDEDLDDTALPSFLRDSSVMFSVVKFKESYAVISIDLELTRRVIERRTGAKPSKESAGKEKGITALERKLLTDLLRDIANIAAGATQDKQPPSVTSLDTADMWNHRKKGELWVTASIGIQEMSNKGLGFFCPSALFIPKPPNLKKTISDHLEAASIILAAELGKFRITVEDLWNLTPGRIIEMSTTVGDPLRLTIGGVPKLLGEPLAQRGNVAVKIQRRIEKGVHK